VLTTLLRAVSGDLWAERYDGKHEDIFDFQVQDKVIKKIVSSLEITLTDSERSRLSNKYRLKPMMNFCTAGRACGCSLRKVLNAPENTFFMP